MKKQVTFAAEHRRFWCLLALLLTAILVRYAFQIDIPRVFFLVIIVLIALLGNRDEILAMILCCIPLHESIDFFYALTLCTCVYIFKYFRQIRFGTNLLLVFLVTLWELLHCLGGAFSPVEFLSAVIPFIVLSIIVASDNRNLDYAFLVRALSWATLGVTIILFVRVLYFANFNFILAIAGLQRLGSDYHSSIQNTSVSGGQINPNTLGIIAVLASTGLMQLRSMGAGKKSDLVLMCTVLVFAGLSTSRTFLACLAMMILLLIFAEKGGAVQKLRLIGLLFLAVAAAAAAMAILFPDTFAYFVSRFSVSDITTGRDTLMLQYHNFIVDNPGVLLFGIGLQDFGYRLIHYFRISTNVPHNSIQEIIIAWGIPGLFLFAALFFSMFYDSSRQNKKQSLINWIPLIIIIFKGLAGQMLNSAYTMLAFSYAYLSLCADLTPQDGNRIFTRKHAATSRPGWNIKQLRRKTNL